MVYNAPGILATPSEAEDVTVGLRVDPHPSQSMNHMFSLETCHNLENLYLRALLNDKRSNTKFLPS